MPISVDTLLIAYLTEVWDIFVDKIFLFHADAAAVEGALTSLEVHPDIATLPADSYDESEGNEEVGSDECDEAIYYSTGKSVLNDMSKYFIPYPM